LKIPIHLRSLISTKIPWCRIAIKSTNLPDSLILSFYPINEEKEEPIDLSPEYLASKKFFRLFVNRSDGDFLLLQINQASAVLKNFPGAPPYSIGFLSLHRLQEANFL
jgi:hypothetical protein